MRKKILCTLGLFLTPLCTLASSAVITEIMYDLPGTDTGREWIEVQNTASIETAFGQWKLFEANTNHGLILFQGNATTSPGGVAIFADDPGKFLSDNPGYSGTLFSSSFSLLNTGETLELKFDNVSVHQTAYSTSIGGAGDGNSLQFTGGVWRAGTPTPGNASSASAESAGSGTPSTNGGSDAEETTTATSTSSTSSAPASTSGGTTTWVYKPQIFVSSLSPISGVAGAPITFDAVAVGVKKEPLPNARYLWSFGDGGTAEGKKVRHTYHYPAVYTVLVDASSGEWSALDRREIMIHAPELVISNLKEGSDGFIEIQNNGASEVDLSEWLIKSGSGIFLVPKGTIIGPKKTIPFPTAITNLLADPKSTALLYPNATLVVSYAPAVVAMSTAKPIPTRKETAVATVSKVNEVDPESLAPQVVTPSVRAEMEDKLPVASLSSSTELIGAVGALPETSTTPWVVGLVLLIGVSVAGYLGMARQRSAPGRADKLRQEAATFDIIE